MSTESTPKEEHLESLPATGLLAGGSRLPIEMLIDPACGYTAPAPRPVPTEEEKSTAYSVAQAVIHHIDQMYPGMWQGVPKTARTSVRNTIRREVERALMGAANEIPF